MSMIVLPYLGTRAASRELSRPAMPASFARQGADASTGVRRGDPLDGLNMRLTYRTVRVLAVIGEYPGASNREIAERSGIVDQGQISKLLTRLARLELVLKPRRGSGKRGVQRLAPDRARHPGRARHAAALRGGRRPPAVLLAAPSRSRAQVLRFLLWRTLGLIAVLLGVVMTGWLIGGGPGAVLRGDHRASIFEEGPAPLADALADRAGALLRSTAGRARWPIAGLLALMFVQAIAIAMVRRRARSRRRYERLQVEVYRGDSASAAALVNMFAALHKRLLRRWWRRLLLGQPGVALEVHHAAGGRRGGAFPAASGRAADEPLSAWFAVCCPAGLRTMVQAAIQAAYPNARLSSAQQAIGAPPCVLRLKKHSGFIERAKTLDRFEQEREPPMNRLLTAMGACGEPAFVQLTITPTPVLFERLARALFKHREAELSRRRTEGRRALDRSIVEDAELRGGLDLQHRPLFFAELRVIASSRPVCERIASELRVEAAENRLVERGTAIRHGLLGLYSRRVGRGEGNPLPSFLKGVFASSELAALWQLPSSDYATVPLARSPLPLAPAPPGVLRPVEGEGVLRDALGPVSIHPDLRRQNTAAPGAVEQGKSSFLVATVAEDLRRDRCAVIVLDPKGDAADAALSLVPAGRTCTLLDLSRPTCGFNPLAAGAPADVIADYVVAALKNLFTDDGAV